MDSGEPVQLHLYPILQQVVHHFDYSDRVDECCFGRHIPDSNFLSKYCCGIQHGADFGSLMPFNGVLAVVGECLLLDPLMKYVKERGVIIIALIGCFLGTFGVVGTAFYPHKWLVFLQSVPECVSQLSFPALSAMMSFTTSKEEQGRLQGAIYAAQSVFAAIGPVVFYATMKKKSQWSQAFPFVIASAIYLVEIGLAFSLKAARRSSPSDTASTISSNEDNDNCEPEVEEGDKIDRFLPTSIIAMEYEQSLMQPLLGTKATATRYFTEV